VTEVVLKTSKQHAVNNSDLDNREIFSSHFDVAYIPMFLAVFLKKFRVKLSSENRME